MTDALRHAERKAHRIQQITMPPLDFYSKVKGIGVKLIDVNPQLKKQERRAWRRVAELRERMQKRVRIRVCKTKEELHKRYPTAKWEESGQILQYGDKKFVQVYLGGHVWVIINVKNSLERYYDEGYDGTVFGYGYVPMIGKKFPKVLGNHDMTPMQEGKPITGDQILFSDKDKLKEYLGPDDPIVKGR